MLRVRILLSALLPALKLPEGYVIPLNYINGPVLGSAGPERTFSSVGQSTRLITGWSLVRVQEGPFADTAVTRKPKLSISCSVAQHKFYHIAVSARQYSKKEGHMNFLIASVSFVIGSMTGLIIACLVITAGNDRRE